MDEEILGQYNRLWRLVRALQEKDYPPETEEEAREAIASFARGLGIGLEETDPRLLQAVEKALTSGIDKILKAEAPPPSVPPNLREIVKIHQDHLAKRAKERLTKAGVPSLEEQIKTHQHVWQTEVKRKGFLGREKTVTVKLEDPVGPIEPEIPEEEPIQERIYQVLKENNLLDDVGQPDPKILKDPEQQAAIADAQKKLASLLQFDELTSNWEWAAKYPEIYPPKYPTHVYWALEETPALLLYPERHRSLAIKLGQEYAQEVTDHFREVWDKTWEETQGNLETTQRTARRAVETLTVDLFQNPGRLKKTVTGAVDDVFKPLNLPGKEKDILIGQTIESLQSYGRHYLTPRPRPEEGYLGKLLPDLPKEVLLDTDISGRPRLKVNPLAQPQNEVVYQPEPTQKGLINQTVKRLTEGPFGSEGVYLRDQLEYFMYNPIGAVTRWTTIDPAIGAIEALIPGAKRLHLLYMDYQFKKGEIMRWYRFTPQLWYLFKETLKREIGIRIGLYKEAMVGTKLKPVLTPWVWAGKATSAPFSFGADYFLSRSRRSPGLFRKNFWFGLSQAFRRREDEWDRSPLVLLVKLAVDLTLGTVGRLIQRAAAGRFARLFTRLTETDFGKRFLGKPAMKGLRMTAGLGKQFVRSFFSLNTLSGVALGYAVGGAIGFPQLGVLIGGGGGHFYQFWLDVGKNERWMTWLRDPSTHFTSKWIRRIVGKPAIWLAEHPYARFPIKGLAFGYILYLLGFPPWVIPLSGLAHWAWSTKGWWGPIVRTGLEKIPGVARIFGFFSRFGFLGRIFGILARIVPLVFPAVAIAPLILDLLSGTPLSLALQHWFGFPWWGQQFIVEVAWLTSPLWWGSFKAGLLAIGNFLAGLVPEVFVVWLSEVIFAITSASAFTLVGIALLVIASGFTLYLLTSAFFVERAISARVISPHLPIEKTVTPVANENGEIIALDYALTYAYQPPAGVTGQLDNIRILDRFEIPLHKALPAIFDLDSSTITPSPPGCQVVWGPDPTLPTSLAWDQNPNAENPFQTCPWLGPLSPGESRTIALHFPLKNPPLSNFLKGDEMLCDTLLVRGQIQGGESLSSSSPPVCINAAGETWIFGWPTCYHNCSSNYGYRPDPFQRHVCEFHEGIDIPPEPPEPPGGCTDIHPSARGVIVKQGRHSGYGCYVIIQHRENLYTLYAHLEDEYSCDFPKNKDDEVAPSDIIGIMDNSGHSTSSHLHFGVSSCGTISCFLSNPEDPCDYLPSCPGSCLFQTRHDCEGSPLL